MAISAGLGFASRPQFALRSPLLHCFQKVRVVSVAAIETFDEPESFVRDNHTSVNYGGKVIEEGSKAPEWKRFSSKELGISNSMIAKPTKVVLNGLKKHGFEVYLVGGCVRDLVLNRTPKDFDIITSAELKQARISDVIVVKTRPCEQHFRYTSGGNSERKVMRVFSRCQIVGRRFPICHVHIEDEFVEVSSFSTFARDFERGTRFSTELPFEPDEKDYIRWKNCLERDFTINGLMFDPYAHLIYDYMGGLEDIRRAKVQTIIPPGRSFVQDCARILRAIRIAARLGFRFTAETAGSIKKLSGSIRRLDKGRHLMEMNYMLAFGSAEPSLRLLWKYGLLEILLPIQAAYLVQQGFKRRDKRSNMLLSLFSNLDKLLTPDRPCHSSLWVAILAFHKALFDRPREPSVVAAFSLAVHNGGDIEEAVNIAMKISAPHDVSFSELSEPQNLDFQALKNEVMALAASVRRALSDMTDEHYVSLAMSMFKKAPYSDLVFIPLSLYVRVSDMFHCVKTSRDKGFVAKQGSKIDYDALSLGSLQEVRHVFARTVFDTVYPLNPSPRSQ